VVLHIANAPFAQRGLRLEQPFLDTLASKYGAGLRLADFENDPTGACNLIDAWVRDQTGGRIPQLLDRVDLQTRLVLVNAIYLKASWQLPFDATATKDLPFTRLDGTRVNVPTMTQWLSEGRYASGPGWQAVDLPYADGSPPFSKGSLSMTIVLPDNMATFEAGLDAAAFSQITAGMQSTNVGLELPRFKIETRSDLSTALTKMGMPLAFDPLLADFSGITKQEQLRISKVIHQAGVSIDEDGTEASAAAAVELTLGAVERQAAFHVDRPFIFAVRDTRTGAILFLGRVVDPSA
jgi:serpin B